MEEKGSSETGSSVGYVWLRPSVRDCEADEEEEWEGGWLYGDSLRLEMGCKCESGREGSLEEAAGRSREDLSPGIAVELGRGVAPIKGLSISDLFEVKCETRGGWAEDRLCELECTGSDARRTGALEEGRVGVPTGVLVRSE